MTSATIIEHPAQRTSGGDVGALEHMLACGEIVAAQIPVSSNWSREKKLAAASFTQALINIRDNAGSPNRRRQREVTEDFEWAMSDDAEWPYSFVRLCELFGVNPDWVRERIHGWMKEPGTAGGLRFSAHRHAA